SPRYPRPALFPYTTLFRSIHAQDAHPARDSRAHGERTLYRADCHDVVERQHCVCLGMRREEGLEGFPATGESFHTPDHGTARLRDRKSTRLNSSHVKISYA